MAKHTNCMVSDNMAPRKQFHPSCVKIKTEIITFTKDLRGLLLELKKFLHLFGSATFSTYYLEGPFFTTNVQ